jgi:hypothetical protein
LQDDEIKSLLQERDDLQASESATKANTEPLMEGQSLHAKSQQEALDTLQSQLDE